MTIAIVGVAVVAALVLLFIVFKKFSGRVLCHSCQANEPRYCSKPERGHAKQCDKYVGFGER